MDSQFFLFDDDPGTERLCLREEILMFYFNRLRPEDLLDPTSAGVQLR